MWREEIPRLVQLFCPYHYHMSFSQDICLTNPNFCGAGERAYRSPRFVAPACGVHASSPNWPTIAGPFRRRPDGSDLPIRAPCDGGLGRRENRSSRRSSWTATSSNGIVLQIPLIAGDRGFRGPQLHYGAGLFPKGGFNVPYLQFDTDFEILDAAAAGFERAVAELYAEQMDADTSYTAVAIRDDLSIHLGRAEDERTVVLKADIRRGRTDERKRNLALAIMDLVAASFNVPAENQKVVFTEHDGNQMMGSDRVGEDWSETA